MTWDRTHITAGECRDNDPGTIPVNTYFTFHFPTNNKKTRTQDVRCEGGFVGRSHTLRAGRHDMLDLLTPMKRVERDWVRSKKCACKETT